MAGESSSKAANGGTAAAAIPNAPLPPSLASSAAPPQPQPPVVTHSGSGYSLPISDEQGANTYKHLLRESVRLHPEKAPSFERIVGGDSNAHGSFGGAAGEGSAVGSRSSKSGGESHGTAPAGLIPLSRLKFIRKVGSGAFAKVDICEYRAADGSVSKVAVKRLTPGVSVLGMVDLAVEARLLRTLHHPYITGFVGVGKDEKGLGFLIEEFVDGELVEKGFVFFSVGFERCDEERKNSSLSLSVSLSLSLSLSVSLFFSNTKAAPSTASSRARLPSPTRPSTPTARPRAGPSRSLKPWPTCTEATRLSSTATSSSPTCCCGPPRTRERKRGWRRGSRASEGWKGRRLVGASPRCQEREAASELLPLPLPLPVLLPLLLPLPVLPPPQPLPLLPQPRPPSAAAKGRRKPPPSPSAISASRRLS